jgi:hypothetical protein
MGCRMIFLLVIFAFALFIRVSIEVGAKPPRADCAGFLGQLPVN